MSEWDKVANIYFGPAPTNIPAGTKVRRWDTAFGGGFLFATLFSASIMMAVWKPLPLLGEIDGQPFGWHFINWIECGIHFFWSQKFVAESQGYINYLKHLPFEMVYGRLWIGAIVFGVSFLLVTKSLLIPRDNIKHVGGAQLKSGQEAQQIAKATTKIAKPFMRIHPDLGLPKTKWTRHMLIYGSVGSGKTQLLLPVLQQIIYKNHKAILYDVKGDFTSYFKDALLISPWDSRSAIWDIAKDISTRDAAQEFTASMIPEGKDPFWSNSGQFLLTGILLSLQAEYKYKWGWKELGERCNWDAVTLHPLLKKYYPKGANVIADPTSQQSNSIISNLAAYTRLIDDLAVAWGDTRGRTKFSLREWVRDDYTGARQIILQGGKGEKLTSAYIAAMMNAVVPEIISPALPDNEQGRTLFFVLDEFTSLAKIKIQSLIDKGRSKGVCVILLFQDIAQVRKVYGADDAKSITSMVGTHIVCQVGSGETREFVANQIVGKRRIATLNTNISLSPGGQTTSTSYNEEDRSILLPSQLTSELGVRSSKSPAGFSIRALYISGDKMLALEWPGADTKKLISRASYEEASWVRPQFISQVEDTEDEHHEEIMRKRREQDQKKITQVVSAEIEAASSQPHKTEGVDPSTDAANHHVAEAMGLGGLATAADVLDVVTVDKTVKPKTKVFTTTIVR